MDGVLWLGNRDLPGLARLFGVLQRRGLGYLLATNNAARTPDQYADRLSRSGVVLAPEQVLTSALITASHLARDLGVGTPVYMVGEEGLHSALTGAGLDVIRGTRLPARAVVVGFDRHLTYAKLSEATHHLRHGAELIGTNGDVTFPSAAGLAPGAGATLAALEAAGGVKARVMGKPEPPMFAAAEKLLGLPPAAIAMVGDRLETDIAGAKGAGWRTVLVTTGVDRATPWGPETAPDAVVSGLIELAEALAAPPLGQAVTPD